MTGWWRWPNDVNVLNATGLSHLKMVQKGSSVFCVFYHSDADPITCVSRHIGGKHDIYLLFVI